VESIKGISQITADGLTYNGSLRFITANLSPQAINPVNCVTCIKGMPDMQRLTKGACL